LLWREELQELPYRIEQQHISWKVLKDGSIRIQQLLLVENTPTYLIPWIWYLKLLYVSLISTPIISGPEAQSELACMGLVYWKQDIPKLSTWYDTKKIT
jgi:hypothetical protein